jgi:hypothetical protein
MGPVSNRWHCSGVILRPEAQQQDLLIELFQQMASLCLAIGLKMAAFTFFCALLCGFDLLPTREFGYWLA